MPKRRKKADWLFRGALVFIVVQLVYLGWFRAENKKLVEEKEQRAVYQAEILSAYERGQVAGHNAAMEQFNLPVMMIRTAEAARAYKYTSSADAAGDVKEVGKDDEEMRGYVDGYHRAIDLIYCPASRLTP